MPILILLNKDFGINEPVFASACKHYWKNIVYYQQKLPSFGNINKLIADKKRVIVTSHSLEHLFKSYIGNLTDEELEILSSKMLIIDDADIYESEEDLVMEIYDLLVKYKNEEIQCKPYSENMIEYAKTFNGPEYFINILFEQYNGQRDWPVITKNGTHYISYNLLSERWEELLGSKMPFKPIDVKRWIWDRSVKNAYQQYLMGPKYRKFTKWQPTNEMV